MYDAAIIGAGVIGCAIARELSKYSLKACVIERNDDVCEGTSKANSGIIHAGFDARPGTLKAKMNVRGNAMMDQLAKELDIPFVRNGSLVVRTQDQERDVLERLLEQAATNQVPDVRILNRDALIAIEPNLSDDVVEALYAPTGGIVCPFHMTIAFAENAHENGVEFFLNTKVTNIRKVDAHFIIDTTNGTFSSNIVVNAAGVYADDINNFVSDDALHITARRGEYMLLDKAAGDHVTHTIFQLPRKLGKGVLVTPTIHGNLLVGPTASDIEDKDSVATTAEYLDSLGPSASQAVKNLPLRQVITSFAGLRAHEACGDFILGEADDVGGFFNAAGIASPGLSSAPAIGEFLAKQIADKLDLQPNTNFNPIRKGILCPDTLSIAERNELIKKFPAYGNIICRCEMITEGEILDAIHRPLGARTLDAVKRRTRAGMGRCQSGFCSPKVMEILVRETSLPMTEISKHGAASTYVVGTNKHI